jgi:hypothetical protein
MEAGNQRKHGPSVGRLEDCRLSSQHGSVNAGVCSETFAKVKGLHHDLLCYVGSFRGERSGSACFTGPLGKTSQLTDDGCNYVFHIKSHVPIDCTFAASQNFNLQDATYYELHICLVTEKDSRELVIRKSANFCGFSLCLTMLRSCASLPASRPVL